MKLSIAIRLGAMLRPQIFGTPSDGIGTCAWGAAHEAAGLMKIDGERYYGIVQPPEWEWTMKGGPIGESCVCPVCGESTYIARVMSVHLNDTHKWTREAIADWVQQVEESLEPAPVSPACEAREECHEAVG